MYPRKQSQSKKSINYQPRFILKPADETPDQSMNTSYLEMYQHQRSNPGQKLQQILQNQITKPKSIETSEERLSKQQFINRSQQVVRQDYSPINDSDKLRDENRTLKSHIKRITVELDKHKQQNQMLINDFEKLRDQLERQSDEFNHAFELMNEEKQLVQQEIDQKDQIIAQLKQQLEQKAQPSRTQMQIDEIKNRIMARKSVHRSSREDIESKENMQDRFNRIY